MPTIDACVNCDWTGCDGETCQPDDEVAPDCTCCNPAQWTYALIIEQSDYDELVEVLMREGRYELVDRLENAKR